jgi:hypothetical protein
VLNCMTKTRYTVVIARSSAFFVFVSSVSCSTRCLMDIHQTLLSLLLWRCQDFLLLIKLLTSLLSFKYHSGPSARQAGSSHSRAQAPEDQRLAQEQAVKVLPMFDTSCQFTRACHAVFLGQFERRPCKPVARPRRLLRPLVARACILCVCIWCFAGPADATRWKSCSADVATSRGEIATSLN